MTELFGQMIAVGRAGGDRGRSGRALVAVMKPADLGDGDDMLGSDRLYRAPAWAVVVETLVRPPDVVQVDNEKPIGSSPEKPGICGTRGTAVPCGLISGRRSTSSRVRRPFHSVDY